METLDLYHLYYAIELFCCVVEHEIEEAVASAGQEIGIRHKHFVAAGRRR
jgi:hypothetical protein